MVSAGSWGFLYWNVSLILKSNGSRHDCQFEILQGWPKGERMAKLFLDSIRASGKRRAGGLQRQYPLKPEDEKTNNCNRRLLSEKMGRAEAVSGRFS